MQAQLIGQRDGGAVSWAQWRLSRGVPLLAPLSRWLLTFSSVRHLLDNLDAGLRSKGIQAPSDAVASCLVAGTLLLGAAGWAASGTPVFGVALVGVLLVALGSWGKGAADKAESAIREEVPDALRSLGVCFQAGLSLAQTLRQTGSEMKGPLGEIFVAAARTLETGGTSSEALRAFGCASSAPELAFVAVALDVQHQSGGSLASVLEAARESVEGELALARSLKVETAQAQLSARIVTLMPFVLVALFSLISPGFLSPFFASLAGLLLLGCALAMQAAGVLLVRHMLDIEVA